MDMDGYTFSHIMSTMATSGIVGMFIGWLLSGSRQAKDEDSPVHETVLPPSDFDIPCPPCKPPRPEPPAMAELAREQSDRVRNEWVDERLPDLLDSVMKAVYEASSDGGKCVVFYTGHNRNDVDLRRNRHKEVALSQAMKERLEAGAFTVEFRAASHKADEDGFGLLISW